MKKFKKKVSKKTTPTFDQIPIPSQTIKRGARAVRGIPYRAIIIGSKISASVLFCPNRYPIAIPKIAPKGNPMPISVKVTQVCPIRVPDSRLDRKAEKIRLGLLISRIWIHRPATNSHRARNSPTILILKKLIQNFRFQRRRFFFELAVVSPWGAIDLFPLRVLNVEDSNTVQNYQ